MKSALCRSSSPAQLARALASSIEAVIAIFGDDFVRIGFEEKIACYIIDQHIGRAIRAGLCCGVADTIGFVGGIQIARVKDVCQLVAAIACNGRAMTCIVEIAGIRRSENGATSCLGESGGMQPVALPATCCDQGILDTSIGFFASTAIFGWRQQSVRSAQL